MDDIIITRTDRVPINPAELARFFWHMDADQQAAFFEAIMDAIRETKTEPWRAEMQWFSMTHELKKRPIGRQVLMSIAAGVYENALRYCRSQYCDGGMG